MSTNAHRHSTRLGAGLLALSALIAIGVTLVFLTSISANHTTRPPTASTARPAPPAALTNEPSGLGNCLVNPDNHALACYHAAQAPIATPAPPGYFRDPTTHKLLRIVIARNRVDHHPPNRSTGGVAP
jgi:hypothetical protein